MLLHHASVSGRDHVGSRGTLFVVPGLWVHLLMSSSHSSGSKGVVLLAFVILLLLAYGREVCYLLSSGTHGGFWQHPRVINLANPANQHSTIHWFLFLCCFTVYLVWCHHFLYQTQVLDDVTYSLKEFYTLSYLECFHFVVDVIPCHVRSPSCRHHVFFA